MSALAMEIDQTLRQLDTATASLLERLVRDALALVKPAEENERDQSIQFPLVQNAQPITQDDVERLQDEV